jgi:hypothetical protein
MSFCSNCGKEIVENAKFCNACGTKVASANAEVDSSSNNKLEEKILSGNGTGNPAIYTVRKYAEIEAVAGFACLIGAFYIKHIGDRYSNSIRSLMYWTPSQGDKTVLSQTLNDISINFSVAFYTMIILGIFCIIWGICLWRYCTKRIKATNVNVYENKVSGVAVDKDFSIAKLIFLCMGWGKAKLANFDIAFNKITSVDIAGNNAIVINASGTNYKCFVSNGLEIQTAINDKIRNG